MPRITPLMLAAAFALLPLTAQTPKDSKKEAPAGEHQRPDRPGPRGPFARLKLTEQQRKAIRAIREKHRAAIEEKRKASREAEDAYREAARKLATAEADLKTLNQKAADARLAVAMAQRTSMQECVALLTPEQKAEFDKFQAEARPFPGRRGSGHGRRGPGGPGFGGPGPKDAPSKQENPPAK